MVQAQTIDMPAALNGPISQSTSRSSADREHSSSRAEKGHGYSNSVGSANGAAAPYENSVVEDLPGAWPKTPNGIPTSPGKAEVHDGSLKEGMGGSNGSLMSVPNADARSERAPSAKSAALSLKSRKSGGVESVSRKSGEGGAVQELSSRPGVAEEGYFAQVPNGKVASPAKSAVQPNGTAAAPEKRPSQTGLTPGSTLSPVTESSPTQPQHKKQLSDGSSRGGPGYHRLSSPPAFLPQPSSLSDPNTPVQQSISPTREKRPDKLMQRHTLEVPRLSTTRTSRDDPNRPPPSADGLTPTAGRFSPTTPQKRRGSLQLARRVTQSLHSHSDMYLDDVPQDEDTARWTEHIKAKRAFKRARMDTDDERVVVGTRVDEKHVNFVTMYNMLTGIRFVVSRTNAKLDRELTPADFKSNHKFSFDISGSELTPGAKYDFKFKDYAPWVFRRLRSSFGLDPGDYLMSLTAKYILSELGSPGKSGSFFYFSRDYKYIIKTIHHAEHKFLRKILKDYYTHVQDNPNTLLSQFYGLHRVKMPLGRKIHFVVMNNLFPPNKDIHRTFDLKGSTIGRDFREEDLEKNPRATLKDLNWLRRNLHLEFGPTKKEAFVKQMQRDVALLQRLKIMDYSLLVGIHDLERGNEENLRDKTLTVFQPGSDREEPQMGMLMRTPSKLEATKRARELRETIKKERPKPIGQDLDQMAEAQRKEAYFYADEGGFRATHEDNRPGEEIYYLGIIDCLTRYGLIKKAEHLWKGMGGKASQISPVPPDRYGDRFVKFISGITKSRERATQERLSQSLEQTAGMIIPPGIEGTIDDPQLGGININRSRGNTRTDAHDPPGTDKVMAKAERQARKSMDKGKNELEVPDRTLLAVRTNDPLDDHEHEHDLLPVIGEAAESGSNASKTPSRITPQPSAEDFALAKTATPMVGDANMTAESLGHVPPPTPPEQPTSDDIIDGRESAEGSRVSRLADEEREEVPPPTPPKDEILRSSRYDKDLPLPPVANMQFAYSPGEADEAELERARTNATLASS